MFGWVKRWWRKDRGSEVRDVPAAPGTGSRRVVRPEQVDHDDPVARQVIADAFNTGGMVIGKVADDGSVVITRHPQCQLCGHVGCRGGCFRD